MTPPANRKPLTARRRQILDVIVEHQRSRGYPPSIREIAAKVGLRSPASVKAHLDVLDSAGYLRVDPTRPRAIEVRYDENSGAALERRPVRHVPLVGDVAAGSGVLASENVEELVPMPADLTGEGDLFMLRVRGDSMVEAGILDGDYVVCRAQSTAEDGEVVVAGIPATRPPSRRCAAATARSCWNRPTSTWSRWSSGRTRWPSTARWSP